MPVKIIRYKSKSTPVKMDLIISTIETNRDRVRTISNMLITTSGILIPACLAFLLFFIDKNFNDIEIIMPISISVLLFLVSTCFSIVSSFLRSKYTITDESQFIEDLLSLLNREIRTSHFAFIFLISGMLSMILGVLVFVLKHWR